MIAVLTNKTLNYTHPNGIKKISKVIYRTDKKNATALNHLVQDDTLQIIEDQKTRIDAVEYIQG